MIVDSDRDNDEPVVLDDALTLTNAELIVRAVNAMDAGTPRPSEADVEALTLAINGLLLTKRWAATGDDIARAVLASDWLASRDAEHEREVVGAAAIGRVLDLDGQVQQARLRAEAAERALADRDAAIKALADEIDAGVVSGLGGNRSITLANIARRLRALLPRDDAAGAGGAG